MSQRLLLLITDLEMGGTPTVVRELAVRLSRIGVDVEVACLSRWGPVADQLRDTGIAVTTLDANGATDLKILPRLIHFIHQRQFSTVFSFLIHANTMAALASLRIGKIRWIQSIQTTQPDPRWHWWMQRLVHRRAEKIVVPSPSVADAATKWSAIPAGKIVVIPNAIDLPERLPEQTDRPLNLQRPFRVTFLGRLDPIKDVPTLVRAVALLNGLVHLDIWGEGDDRSRIEREIQQQKAPATLKGIASIPQQALQHSDLLVLPSLAEGFGLVLIEAMAAGIPVIASNVPGICDVITDNWNGLLVPPSQPGQLAKAIQLIVDNPSLKNELIANGLTHVRQHFTWQTVLPQYRSLLAM